jgi:L-ascorbate metabolism protein UlaG (beta-lactamase superfamily)
MKALTLGWAGVELEHDGVRLAIDPFADLGPFAAFAGPDLELRAPEPGLAAVLLTHLHRDHADPVTLAGLGAPVLGPRRGEGPGHESVDRVEAELEAAGISVERLEPGDSQQFGPFTVTAVDATDGLGDPQVSWVVAAGDTRVFHGGDTLWHGAWWRIAKRYGPFDAAFLPANGARTAFPWMEPAADMPACLTPEQAVQAARALGARELVAVHHGSFGHDQFYRPVPDVPGALAAAAAEAGVSARAAFAGEVMAW